ncbi:hypothetical protein EQ827_08290 [Lactobacillus bombi]|nr:hypothetical protein [Bombilactobacillus bombi]
MSLLFIGGIIILETQWSNVWGWGIIGVTLLILAAQIQQHVLIIDSHHQILIIHGLINSNRHRFSFSQIKKIEKKGHQCILIFQDKSYFPLKLWLSKKGQQQLNIFSTGSDQIEK